MNEHTRDVVLFEINIFAADIDIESEPNRVYHWILNRGCDCDKHCVYSCRFMWGLADYWRSMSNRVTENVSVLDYQFNETGVRRSAVCRRSSLATISIRLNSKNNINLSDTEQNRDKDKDKDTILIRLNCKNSINLSDTLEQDGSQTFLWQEVPPQQVTFPWSYVIHNLNIAKFINMIVFWLDLGTYLVRKRIISFCQYYHRAAILLLQASKIPHEEKNLNLFRYRREIFLPDRDLRDNFCHLTFVCRGQHWKEPALPFKKLPVRICVNNFPFL